MSVERISYRPVVVVQVFYFTYLFFSILLLQLKSRPPDGEPLLEEHDKRTAGKDETSTMGASDEELTPIGPIEFAPGVIIGRGGDILMGGHGRGHGPAMQLGATWRADPTPKPSSSADFNSGARPHGMSKAKFAALKVKQSRDAMVNVKAWHDSIHDKKPEPVVLETRMCFVCMSMLEKPLRCSRCRNYYYCTRECQVAHWPTHKDECEEHLPDLEVVPIKEPTSLTKLIPRQSRKGAALSRMR